MEDISEHNLEEGASCSDAVYEKEIPLENEHPVSIPVVTSGGGEGEKPEEEDEMDVEEAVRDIGEDESIKRKMDCIDEAG